MKKAVLFLAIFFTTHAMLKAQSYLGINTGRYMGVNEVFENPAGLNSSPYKWHVNLIGIGVDVANNTAIMKMKGFNEIAFENIDLNRVSKPISGNSNIDFLAPSFMLTIKQKNTVAFSYRVRSIVSISQFDGKTLNQFINPDEDLLETSYTSPFVQKFTGNMWQELSGSYSREVYKDKEHSFYAGATIKLLKGYSNNFLTLDNIGLTLKPDILRTEAYITQAQGKVSIGSAGLDFTTLEDAEAISDVTDLLKNSGKGIGADIGIQYIYTPTNSLKNQVKIGVSLMDIGSIKYKLNPNHNGEYSVQISANERWYPSDLEDKSVEEIKEYLDSSPFFTNLKSNTTSRKVALPTSLRYQLDYSLNQFAGVAVNGLLNLGKKDSYYNPFLNNSICVTPRFEMKFVGLYLPVSYHQISKFNAGVALRLGPIFLGYSSLFNLLADKSHKADFYFGVKFGGIKKQKKTNPE